MSENTIDFARRRMPILDAAAKQLTEELQKVNDERALLRPILKAAQQQGQPAPEAPQPPPDVSQPPPRKARAGAAPTLGAWRDPAPGQEGIIGAVVNGASGAESDSQ